MQEQAEQNPSRWTPELILQAVKEVVTAALGLFIVSFTLAMAYKVFTYVGENEKISDAKDVLMLVLGLSGVVIGYYFGRVPADARAAQAQGQAEAANVRVEKLGAAAQATSDQVDQILADIAQPSAAARGAGGEVSDQLADNLRQVRDKLRQLSTIHRGS
ncbi:MAG: hypothetical protein ACXW22_15310 [Allosphingosinicella sp.]